jgi:hypothetical protein
VNGGPTGGWVLDANFIVSVTAKPGDRIRNPVLSLPALHAAARQYLRDLRAAEMIAWEMTGGGYLISR